MFVHKCLLTKLILKLVNKFKLTISDQTVRYIDFSVLPISINWSEGYLIIVSLENSIGFFIVLNSTE